jgi:hypothetical protein
LNLSDAEYMRCMCKAEFITNKELAEALHQFAQERVDWMDSHPAQAGAERDEDLHYITVLITASARLEEMLDSERIRSAYSEQLTQQVEFDGIDGAGI